MPNKGLTPGAEGCWCQLLRAPATTDGSVWVEFDEKSDAALPSANRLGPARQFAHPPLLAAMHVRFMHCIDSSGASEPCVVNLT